ncbi:MAG: GGDEF domain-containing phosphodiesterase, partial [Pseudomonadota bacterium]
IARISADCFAVLATELASPDEVMTLVSKLQTQLSTPFVMFNRTVSITTGIGISVYPRDSHDFSTLLQHADIAMHRVKEKGDGGFQFYAAEMTRSASDRVRLETELRQAISGRQLEMYYQLQVGIQNENVVGVEALMRWNHPEQGLLSPDRFIPIAENSELIYALGEWALRTACQQLVEWDRQGAPRLRMAVNVSARQFRARDFVEMVANALDETKLDPRRLELELTESVLVSDQEEAAAILQKLNGLGVQIALDDFGTGYSNLSYLSRLPIHTLKIDRSFVQRAPADSNDAEIVRAVITLADALGLRVVAEGIETQRQLDLLRRYQCTEGQGFFFARPLPATVLAPLIGLGAYQRTNKTESVVSREKK